MKMNVIVNTVSPCTYPTIGFEERFKDGRGVDRLVSETTLR
jgi:hypothetical protein